MTETTNATVTETETDNNELNADIMPPAPNLELVRSKELDDLEAIISRIEKLPLDKPSTKSNIKGVDYSFAKKLLAAELVISGKFSSRKEVAAAVGMKAEGNVRSALKAVASKKHDSEVDPELKAKVLKELAKTGHRKINPEDVPEYVALKKEFDEFKAAAAGREKDLETQLAKITAKAEIYNELRQEANA